jgi:endonuclease/exonuclease/phosphatase family metal-dependent hydrolase
MGKFRPVRIAGLILACILLIVILWLSIVTMTDYRPGKKEAPATTGQAGTLPAGKTDFKIFSWNLGYFGLGERMDFFYDGGRQVRPPKEDYLEYARGGEDLISSLDSIDFFLFQEVDRRSKRSFYHDQFQDIAGLLPGYKGDFAANYNVFVVPMPLYNPMGKVLSGLSSYNLYTPEEAYRGALPGQFYWPLRLFMLDRCFLFTRFRLDSGKDLIIINTHNEPFDKGEIRLQQMESLRQIMLTEYDRGNYVVTGGDWNMNPVGYRDGGFVTGDISRTVLPLMEKDFFPEGWKWVFDPSTPTNRDVDEVYTKGETPTTIIDFFVVSPNVTVSEIHAWDLRFQWSDHQPVIMRFSCPGD